MDIIGYVDQLGYLLCPNCKHRAKGKVLPVHRNAAPHNIEPCDVCGEPLEKEEGKG